MPADTSDIRLLSFGMITDINISNRMKKNATTAIDELLVRKFDSLAIMLNSADFTIAKHLF